ncbi:riboflavin synthase [Sulfurospirillum diekertiae]|uniref:Riboflavin synthase n=1 Tax=Sulfurospirillum diekertiae TaxID=1854492 RepID=A0A1Y0HMX5_9BACT|nr:riboflavin synthase [Sulfurospirillum diekertiae]ARU49487.1 Riboflavin synthase [Sulfurospirillum diekertiae]ASC94293.1 Riboflavin synthase [Sulfurospirillum diekertiae]
MFTGLIHEFAEVKSYSSNILTLCATYKPKIGDSIAVNGACLTVIQLFEGGFSVELSLESRSLLAVENLKGKVHIEPALALGDRLDGHMVQGHVDCVGVIEHLNQRENGLDIEVSIPEKQITFVIPKGSITIDGVSLTVNDVSKKSFRLTIIPHTLEKTLIGSYKIGRKVNVETDMFARYLYHMFQKKDALDWNGVDRIMAIY